MKHIYWPLTVTCPDEQYSSEHSRPLEGYLKKTHLLNYTHSIINDLVETRGWLNLNKKKQTSEIFNFVKNDIVFGYNTTHKIPASNVLLEGVGCCNNKSALLMALLRICRIPCRFHGVGVDKRRFKTSISGLAYYFSPRKLVFSWVEIYLEGKWLALTGYMFDRLYLQSIEKERGRGDSVHFDGNIAIPKTKRLAITSREADHYYQIKGLHHYYGVFNSPDDFYQRHNTDVPLVKSWLFKHLARNRFNNKLSQIRQENSRKQVDATINAAASCTSTLNSG